MDFIQKYILSSLQQGRHKDLGQYCLCVTQCCVLPQIQSAAS
jgi:hypothetical protein